MMALCTGEGSDQERIKDLNETKPVRGRYLDRNRDSRARPSSKATGRYLAGGLLANNLCSETSR